MAATLAPAAGALLTTAGGEGERVFDAQFAGRGKDAVVEDLPEGAGRTFEAFRDALGAGTIRAASPDDNGWHTNAWVKKGIIVGFRLGC